MKRYRLFIKSFRLFHKTSSIDSHCASMDGESVAAPTMRVTTMLSQTEEDAEAAYPTWKYIFPRLG